MGYITAKLIIIVAISLLLVSCSNSCKRFLVYNETSFDVKGLKSKIKNKSTLNIGMIEYEKIPVETTERLKELDLMQFVFCSQLKQIDKKSTEWESLNRSINKVYLDMAKSLTINNQNSRGLLSPYELEKLRGRKDGYSVGFVRGRLNKYFDSNGMFPDSLLELNLDPYLKALGYDKYDYLVDVNQDNYTFVFAGSDQILNTTDDYVYNRYGRIRTN